MKLVQHLLETKGRKIFTISEDASVFDAIRLMASHSIGSLLVMQDQELKGIVTERDYARKVILQGRSAETARVGEIMSTRPITATPDQTVKHCMELMTDRRIRHLPVVTDGRVVGLISIGDLVQAIISDQQKEIEQLESYISG